MNCFEKLISKLRPSICKNWKTSFMTEFTAYDVMSAALNVSNTFDIFDREEGVNRKIIIHDTLNNTKINISLNCSIANRRRH